MDRRNFERYLPVKIDEDKIRYFDLHRSVYFPESMTSTLSEDYIYGGESWTQLSHKIYGTVHLFWLILAFNNIDNPFEPVKPGTKLRFPKAEVVRNILQKINLS